MNFSAMFYGISAEHKLLFVVLMIWTLIWKGLALWKAARKDSKTWFVILLIFNTLGILDIIYIYLISNRKKMETLPTNSPTAQL